LCYEPKTCISIDVDDKEIYDMEADKTFKICTFEDINEVLSQKDINNQDGDKKSYSLLIVIIVCAIVNLIGFLISFILIKKNRSKRNKKADTSFDDLYQIKKPNTRYNACIRISLVVTFITFITVVITLLIKILILQ